MYASLYMYQCINVYDLSICMHYCICLYVYWRNVLKAMPDAKVGRLNGEVGKINLKVSGRRVERQVT